MAVPEGEYRIAIEGIPAGLILKSVTQEERSLLNAPLKLSATDPSEVIITFARDRF